MPAVSSHDVFSMLVGLQDGGLQLFLRALVKQLKKDQLKAAQPGSSTRTVHKLTCLLDALISTGEHGNVLYFFSAQTSGIYELNQ